MAFETQKYIRKPLYVDAVRITAANFDDIVTWCGGEVMRDEVPGGKKKGKRYIKVDVDNPKNIRQTKAKVGDWLLKSDRGFKVYTNDAFHASFHTVEEDHRTIEEVAIGRGREELELQRGEGLIYGNEEVVPGVTVNEAIRLLREHAKMQDAVGPDVELVPATPQSIAQAVEENEAARAQEEIEIYTDSEYPETHTIGGTPREEINVNEPFSQGGGGPVDLAEDVKGQSKTVEDVPEQEKVDPIAAEGKRVLSIAEQSEMDSDEIRELIKSGEVVLAQDIAAA